MGITASGLDHKKARQNKRRDAGTAWRELRRKMRMSEAMMTEL
ncbi:MAG: hypothetical protein ACLTBK_09380 [Blautia wexlerae]